MVSNFRFAISRPTLAILALAAGAASHGQAQLHAISAPAYIAAAAVSADGRYVAGYYDTPLGNSGYRWSVGGGFEDLGRPLGTAEFRNAYVKGISGDGSKVVGYGTNPSAPYVWEQGVGVSAPTLPYATIVAVSADGSTYAGLGEMPNSYRTKNGVTESLGLISGSYWSAVNGMSDDGKTLVGAGFRAGNQAMPFVWREGVGIQETAAPAGYEDHSFAQNVSRDGRIVVGDASNAVDQNGVFVWTEAGGAQLLEKTLNPAGRTYVDYATNGGMIFGKYEGAFSDYSAAVWESSTGVEHDLKAWLTSNYGLGSTLTGWNLKEIVSVSADGRTLAGNGTLNGEYRSFMIQLDPVPEPASLVALAGGLAAFARRRRR